MTTATTNTTHAPPRLHRARWAAIGAAVAVALGAAGLGIAHATQPAGATAFVPIEPCRLVDTRSDARFHVGPHSTLGADKKITIDGWDAQGECTSPSLPTTSTGLQLNVTALGATMPTHLTIYPGTGDAPNASSLNPVPGQPPTPNAVTVPLDGAGKFSVYNFQGSVDVIIDVVGYYGDHHHDDRYAPIDHDHVHEHDDRYARIDHDHVHDHDDRYGAGLPDAMAGIRDDGMILGGGENIASIVYNETANQYEIEFEDISFSIISDVVIVSAVDPSTIATASSVNDTLLVRLRDVNGDPKKGYFNFVVWDN